LCRCLSDCSTWFVSQMPVRPSAAPAQACAIGGNRHADNCPAANGRGGTVSLGNRRSIVLTPPEPKSLVKLCKIAFEIRAACAAFIGLINYRR
jgi:hypothetical protein